MTNLSFAKERRLPQSPATLWREIVHGSSELWPVGLGGASSVGDVVRFLLVQGTQDPVHATGRILRLVPFERIELQQESPWSSRIVIKLVPDGAGTRVKMIVNLGADAVEQLMPWAGTSSADRATRTDEFTLGLLVSLTGASGIFGRGALNAATLAVEEINATGGLEGKKVRLVTEDDRTSDSALGAYHRLTRLHGCTSIIGMVPSPSIEQIRKYANREKRLLLHTPLNDGGVAEGLVFQLGARPRDQLVQSIPFLMQETGERNWYLVGNDYSWPRAIRDHAIDIIEASGARVVGSQFVPIGTANYHRILDDIRSSRAGLVLSSFVGHNEAEFESEFHAAGLRSQAATLATLLDGTTLQHIKPEARSGIWSTIDDFNHSSSSQDAGLAGRWLTRFGPLAPPLSSLSKSVYDAVHLFARASRQARSLNPVDVGRQLRSSTMGRSSMLTRAAGERVHSELVRIDSRGAQAVAL